jgi:hypothetical protein
MIKEDNKNKKRKIQLTVLLYGNRLKILKIN